MEGLKVQKETLKVPGQTCKFFVERKQRYCKMLVKEGKLYCGQHLVVDNQGNSSRKRIPCPLDPKHSCFENRLKQHVAICNARERSGVPYFNRNINLDSCEDEPKKTSLHDLSDEELLQFISRVETRFTEHVGEIKEEILQHTCLDKELSMPGYGLGVLRHLTQNASLLGHLQQEELLQPQATTCYVEFGAGRGQLTQWLTESVQNLDLATFLLIDRGAQRYKADAKLKYNAALKIKRLRVDIQHLDLTGVEEVGSLEQLVATGKHLCGGATDLTLKCLCQMGIPRVAGAVIALCCHHRCSWGTYIGKDVIQSLGFTSQEFYTLLALTSWATCSSQDAPDDDMNAENKDKDENYSTDPLDDKNENENLNTKLQFSEIEMKDASLPVKIRKTKAGQDVNSVEKEESNEDKQTEKENSEIEMKDASLPVKIRKTKAGQDVNSVEKEESNEDKETEKENRYSRLRLSSTYREEIGRQAKQLLDYGRLKYMQRNGFNARLIQYVKRNMTLENIAIVVMPKNT